MIPVPWYLKEKHCVEPCYYLPTSLLSASWATRTASSTVFVILPTNFSHSAPILYPPPPVHRLGKLQAKCTCVSMSNFSQGHQKREVRGKRQHRLHLTPAFPGGDPAVTMLCTSLLWEVLEDYPVSSICRPFNKRHYYKIKTQLK